MGRYCDGEAAAFRALYALVAPRILAYVGGLLGDRALAEDALQQVFLKVHQARGVYVRAANPIPWIYTIAHRVCLDELRSRRRARVKLTADGALPAEPRASLTGQPEGAFGPEIPGNDGAGTFSMEALAELPENQREALVLTKLQGHSLAEAAQITGSTPGAIKLRAHRAYVTLRKRFEQAGPLPEEKVT